MHFAGSGEQALDRLAEEIQPALVAVLSDINMPGMDGLQLLGEIKQRRPELPVMMVSAYGDDDRRHRARELGALDFIPKPVDFDQLIGGATGNCPTQQIKFSLPHRWWEFR
jgi:CheY-like chemotaxis protein